MATVEELTILVLIISSFSLAVTVIAVIIAFLIKRDTRKMKQNQISNAQLPYQKKTYENINEIAHYYREILKNLHVSSMETGLAIEEETEDELVIINSKLSNLFKQSKTEMTQLIQRTDKDLRSWADVNQEANIGFRKIVTNFEWVIDKFFLEDIREEDQIRNWQRFTKNVGSYKEHLEKNMKQYDYLFTEKD